MNHLDDDAELYALGLTERARSAEIEAHIAECADCRARVIAAEAAGEALAATLPPVPAAPARRTWWPALATAAAVVFAATAGVQGAASYAARAELARTDVALTAIASSHFGHTTLTSESGVVAKAIYARDGAWCYIVATGAPSGAHVLIRHGAAARDAGALGAGSAATLFVRAPGRADEVSIVAGDRVIAHGAPVY
jgi:hypothetical protein